MSEVINLEKKKTEVIIKTAALVYDFLKENKNVDDIDTLNFVRREYKYDYSNTGLDESLELFAVQEGAVYITYRYIKENPDKRKGEVVKFIAVNYSDLLEKYSEEE